MKCIENFCYDGHQFVSALTFTEYSDRVIVVDSFSKRYSMCGARIGALVTKNKDVINGATKLAQARLMPLLDIEQTAALAALQTPRSIISCRSTERVPKKERFFSI